MQNASPTHPTSPRSLPSRRMFFKKTALAAMGAGIAARIDPATHAHAAGSDRLRIGLVGCGGRGSGGGHTSLRRAMISAASAPERATTPNTATTGVPSPPSPGVSWGRSADGDTSDCVATS